MKFGIIQYGMWFIFANSFKSNLNILQITDKKEKKEIMARAYSKYHEIISEIEPFGKNDVLLVNILSASAFAAIYLSLPTEYRLTSKKDVLNYPETEECEMLVSGKYTMKELADFYECSMNGTTLMKLFLKRSFFSKSYWKTQKSQAERSQHSTNPYSWKYTFHPDKRRKHFDAFFSHCGIWHLMQELGVPEITPAMCKYDYGMTKYSDVVFSRKGTLAGGAQFCDCHYDKKEIYN